MEKIDARKHSPQTQYEIAEASDSDAQAKDIKHSSC